MIRMQACPVCAEPAARELAFGVVAPWIIALIGAGEPVETTLRRCSNCGLRFFDQRYEPAEMAAIYGGYRTSEYFRVRHHYEPWYRAAVNEAFDPGSPAVAARVATIDGALDSADVPRDLGLVVDVGGDVGQFFPSAAKGRRVLLDVSDRPAQPGVERVANIRELPDTPDLIMCCHVLEHLPDPMAQLRELRGALRRGSWLYLEVPMDGPRDFRLHRSRRYQLAVAAAAKRRTTLLPLDFISGAMRQVGLTGLPVPVVKQSEHINYFDRASVAQILSRAGFKVRYLFTDPSAKPSGFRLGLVSAVAEAI